MQISPEVTTALLTLGGAVVGALPGLIGTFLNRKSDDKKQMRELVMKTAAENWRFVAENSQNRPIVPFEHFMIHTSMMCEHAFSDTPITLQNTKEHLAKVSAVMDALYAHANAPRPPAKAA
jgi:hypothetical protein